MATFGSNYNAADVLMGRPRSEMVRSGPYLWTGTGSRPPAPPMPLGPDISGGKPAATPTSTPQGILAPESIRATGAGPFDAAYRQNLATYAGGQFSRPPGGLNFNPTDPSTFPGLPTGGGTAPVTGMPQSLLDMALSGQGFSWTPPQPAKAAQKPGRFDDMVFWMDQFMRGGRGGRMGSIL